MTNDMAHEGEEDVEVDVNGKKVTQHKWTEGEIQQKIDQKWKEMKATQKVVDAVYDDIFNKRPPQAR